MSVLHVDIYHYCLGSCDSIITHFIFSILSSLILKTLLQQLKLIWIPY